jgi:discoidin domain receptor family protein 2
MFSLISGGIVSYQVPEDSAREPDQDLSDSSYDGARLNGELVGGLGRLVDGEVGGDNFKLDIGYGKGEFGSVTGGEVWTRHVTLVFPNTSRFTET